MKSKVSAVIVLAVIFVAFSLMSSVKSAHENAPQYSTVLLTDGGAPTTTLLADGPGPMCPPTAGCGSRDLGLAREEHTPQTILLVDGPGPMCPPRTGCGYKKDSVVKPNSV